LQEQEAVNSVSAKAQTYFDDTVSADLVLPAGTVCVRQQKSPEKPTAIEDAAAVISSADGTLVLAVADGVGGSPGGREAAIGVMQNLESVGSAERAVREDIIEAIDRTNAELLSAGRGSATTLALVEIAGGTVRSYHAGDSEVLVVGQRGKIRHFVVPHSPTGFAVQAGLIGEDEAMHHELRHVLHNFVGAPTMRIEIGAPIKLQPFDTVLLASDGLFDNLYLREIVAIIRCGPLAQAADRLMAKALERMRTGPTATAPSKPDDVAIVLYRPRKKT
jgi:serine/threonine protein phosphatase PrpC